MNLKYVRLLFIALSIALLILGIGFLFQMDWAKSVWPWPDGRLSYIFLASILAAIVSPMLWVSFVGEWGAVASSALFPLIMSAGTAIFLIQLAVPPIFVFVLVLAVLYSLAIILWGRRIPLRDTRPLPKLARISFAIFSVVLVIAGGVLILKLPNIMPWPIGIESSVTFGWIFLGAASSYIFGALNPRWHYARAPLLGFLIYDLVLGFPLIAHFADVKPEHQLSLIIYTIVVIYSTVLAVYYLFIQRETRTWAIQVS